jgi:hypothetical protein
VIVLIVRLLLARVPWWIASVFSLVVGLWSATQIWQLWSTRRSQLISIAMQRLPVLLSCMTLSFGSGIVMQQIGAEDSTKNFLLLVITTIVVVVVCLFVCLFACSVKNDYCRCHW